ncbi:MAG TPA: EAL domain-containing protein [Acidobacteriota bacterium]|nr:EAL domain-containing protein [Acidobacteriota bacterium]
MQPVETVVDATAQVPTEPEESSTADIISAVPPAPAPQSKDEAPARRSWNPILTALGGLYLVSAASHLIARPELDWLMIMLVVLTGLTLVALRCLFSLNNLSAGGIESISAILAGLVLLNTLYHLYYLSGEFETVNLALLGVGIATFFLPSSRLTLVLACTLGVWVIIAWSSGTTTAWLHFAFGLFAAAGLRLHTEFRQSELKLAYAAAEREIAKRKEVEQALRDSEERYALAAEGSHDGLWDWNLRTHKVYYSPRWSAMIGYESHEIGEHPSEWLRRVHPTDRPKVRNALLEHIEGRSPHFEAEYRILHRDGNYRWMLCRGLAVRDGDERAYRIAGSQTDVTARKLAEEQLLHDAFHDHLTGLPNRALFIDRLETNLKRRSRSPQYQFALLFLDLDRFKIVNDSLGHLAGDLLLKILAKRLESSVRSVDTVARFGGDEFAILLSELKEPADAIVVAERIQKELQVPFPLGDHQVFTTASIGIVVSSPEYQYADEMLRDADTAMYRAKMRGKGSYELFNGEMLCNTRSVLQLENDLRNALRRKEFVLHYQPIIYLKTGKIAGFEALIRWNHPERGLLTPGQFLAVAEDADLLVPIGWQTLEEACAQLCRWRNAYPDLQHLSVSVNLSAKQFSCPDLIEKLERVMKETGIEPAQLKLEITEGIVMQSVDSSLRILGELHQKGIHLHLDDFGTGYSALSYLHQFPITTLKTDRSFISRRGTRKENRAVLQAVVQMASDLGMEVVVEGIETPEQFAEVLPLKCEYGQGYLFSRPLDPAAAERLLADNRDLRPESCLKNLPMFCDYEPKAGVEAAVANRAV